LDDILQRMAGHQIKKRPLLRALRAWSGGSNAEPGDKVEQTAATKKSASLSTRQRPKLKAPD
jgi:hypothetical protein